MRVSVLINPKAGTVEVDLIEKKINEALFRCDLKFHISKNDESMNAFIKSEIAARTNVLLVCGGDGTINATLQCLMKNKAKDSILPPICIICSGTANDLAHEIGVGERVEAAARLILEGKEKKIDVIEIRSGHRTKYMITNGGLGIPATTADKANRLRAFLQALSSDQNKSVGSQILSQYSYRLVKKMGSFVYSALLLDTLLHWAQEGWKLEIEFPNKRIIATSAPFLLVNNQPTLGKKYLTAPFTSNNDGQVNLLAIESPSRLSQLEKVLQVYRGRLRPDQIVKSFESAEFILRAKNKERKLTFFGDGEILFRDVEELHVRCLKQILTVMVHE